MGLTLHVTFIKEQTITAANISISINSLTATEYLSTVRPSSFRVSAFENVHLLE